MRFSPRFLQLLREAKAGGVLVEEVTWARLGQISGGAVHQGIVLQPAAAETLDLPSLIDGCRSTGEAPLLIAVDGLTDPQNLGAIVRSAEALGAHGLVLPQRRNAGLTGSVAKVAAGALEHLPVARVVNLNRSLEALKDEGYRVIGLASEGSVTLEEADLDGPLVVVTGSEGDGLSLLTRKHCDQLVRIPLRGTTPSLNASVATALLLYEIARRGWMQGLRGNSPAPRLVRPALPAPAPSADSAPAAVDPAAAAEVVDVAAGEAAAGPALLEPVSAPEAFSAEQAEQEGLQDAAAADAGAEAPVWHAAIAADPLLPERQEPASSAQHASAAPVERIGHDEDAASGATAADLAEAHPGLSVPSPGVPDLTVAPLVTPAGAGEPQPARGPETVDRLESSGDAGMSFQGDIRL